MLSFLNSAPRPIYYSSPVYRDADSLYRPYLSYPSLVADPEVRYRRALSEYFTAEEEYNAVLRAREEARIHAHAEDLRRERARLLRAQIARARQEQQARQLEQALAELLSRAAAVPEGAHDHLPLRVRNVVPRSLSDTAVPRLRAHQSQKEKSLVSSCDCAPRPSEQQKSQPDNGDEAKANVNPYRHFSQPDERSALNLESLLRCRLQKIVGDEEVQDVARAILRRLTPTTGGIRPPAPAFSPECSQKNTSTQPLEGADLSRSDALQGIAAEAAKESFKAHRAEAGKSDEPAPSHTSKAAPSSLTIIQDIRSALEKLSSDFSFPSSLDLSDEPDGLAYTPTNAPIRVYEHALDGLLEQLDAIESDGDEEVRVERRAVVKEVEKAIEDVERKVRKAREGAKRDSQTGGKTLSAEADLTTDKVSQAAETEADGLSGTSPDDRLNPASVRLPNSDVSLPITVADSESVAREDVKDEFSLESARLAEDFAATPAATDGAEPSQFSIDDALKSELDALPEQGTSDETLATPSASSAFATPVEPSPVVSHPIVGAIPPSSTPVSPTLPSSEISEDGLLSLGHEQFSASLERLGGDVDDDDANGDEHEWIDIKA